MDSQFAWNAAFSIGMTGLAALAGMGGRYLSQIHKSLEDQLKKQEKLIEQIRDEYKNDVSTVGSKVDMVQEDLSKFKVQVQRDFVNREEYIRTTQSLDAKIDRVLGEIGKIQVNMAKLASVQGVNK